MEPGEFDTVSLADVPPPQRRQRAGQRGAALRALLPGQAIRIAVPAEDVAASRTIWASAANRALGRKAIRTRYADGHLYIWRKEADGDA